MPFLNPLCSLSSTSCYCLAATHPSFSADVISLLPTFTSTCQQNHPVLSPFSLFPTHLFTPTPHSYQHTLQSFSFSLDVFHSLPSNHTSHNSASITQIIVSFASTIITSTFTQNCHSFSHFDSTSARIHSTSTPPIY